MTAWSAATGLRMGSFRQPGSGFLPFALACALALLSLILLAGSWKESGGTAFWPERTWVRPTLGSLVLFAYALFVGVLGFVPVTFLFMVFWMRTLEGLSWRTVLPVTAIVTAGLYLVFVWFLGVPMPSGFFK